MPGFVGETKYQTWIKRAKVQKRKICMIAPDFVGFLFYFFSSIALVSGLMVIRSKNPVHSVLFLILVFCNAAGLLLLLHLDFFAMIFLVVYVGAIAVLFLFVVMMLHIKLTEMNENILRYLPVGGIIGFIFLVEVLLIVENDLIPVLNYEILQNWGETSGVYGFPISWVDFFYYKIRGLFMDRWISSAETLVNSVGVCRHTYSDLLNELSGFDNGTKFSINHMPNAHTIGDLYSFQYIQWPICSQASSNIETLGQILYTYYFYFFIIASLILLIAMIGAIVLTLESRNPMSVSSFTQISAENLIQGKGISGLTKLMDSRSHEGKSVKRQQIFLQNSREFTKTIKKLRNVVIPTGYNV